MRILYSVILIGLTLQGWAQSPISLSLQEAIKICLQNNFDIQIERIDKEIAQQNNNWQEAGQMPTVSFNGAQNNSSIYNRPANPFALAGTNRTDNFSGQLDVQWIIYNGFRVKITKKRLEQLQAQSEIDLAIAIENTIQTLILTYFRTQLEQESLKVLEHVLKLSADRLAYVRFQKELGTATSFEISQQETIFYTDSSNFVNQQLNVNNAFRDLNFLMAKPNLETVYWLTDSLSLSSKTYYYDELLAKIKSDNTAYQRQLITEELAKTNIDVQALNLAPTFRVNLGYNANRTYFTADFPQTTVLTPPSPSGTMTWEAFREYNANTQRITNYVNDTRMGYTYGPYVNFTLNVPIYQGGRNLRAIQTARWQAMQSNLQTQRLELSLANDLQKALNQYENRRQSALLSLKSKEAAETNLRLSRERLQTGIINSFDYRQVQT
ncbi:MAG: TolC family protein, partial [Flammeovirgaceae bacterium]|nr:TolC family protein [Flammeovirgaceae bacterium]